MVDMKDYSLGLYEKSMPASLSWKEKLLAAKAAGFDFIEISIDETDEKLARLYTSKQERLKLIETMYETGLEIRTMCLSGHRKYPLGSSDPKIIDKSLEIMERAIELALDLGIRIIQLAGYDVYYEESTKETVDRFENNLKKATLMAAKAGVLLGFETMETEFMNTVEKAMKYVRSINSSYLYVYPDAGNLTNAALAYGKNVLEDVKCGKGHILAMHLKETVPGVFREIPFGTGHVDFEKIINTAWNLGVRKFVAEFWYIGSENWMDDLYDANNMLTSFLDKEQAKARAIEKQMISKMI